MSDFLKLYSYTEFINEYGDISNIDINTATLLTVKNIKVYLANHYKKAIDEQITSLNINTLKHSYFILLNEDNFDENGYKYKERKWYLFMKGFLNKEILKDSNYYVLFKNISYLSVIQRRNFCKILIQQNDNSFFELDKVDINTFEYNGNQSYSIKTNLGTLNGKYTSRIFISTFAKILSINSNGCDEREFYYILYMDGRFERASNKSVIAIF